MQSKQITVNKSAENPEGISIHIAVPENPTEEALLNYLLPSFLRELKHAGKLPYEFPEQFRVMHRGEGTFIATGFTTEAAYYEPPRPIAIFGLRVLPNNQFDLIHAAPVARRTAPPTPAQAPTTQPAAPAEPQAPTVAELAPESSAQPADQPAQQTEQSA